MSQTWDAGHPPSFSFLFTEHNRELGYACPATDNGPNRDYVSHTYTTNQAQAAIDYAHFLGNQAKLPFDCGVNKAEFPLRPDGQIFAPPRATSACLPDRVVYEFRCGRKETLSSKVYGVMRHEPDRPFLNCPEPSAPLEDEGKEQHAKRLNRAHNAGVH
ncbi:hypothetical protein PG994_008117 [Apiospora phragmitis]|uniref:Uncharacterized protein n=1 Tax=Apiospora phragmitis TaxID=2905665 RepID=A0ABR1US46_9PEZI